MLYRDRRTPHSAHFRTQKKSYPSRPTPHPYPFHTHALPTPTRGHGCLPGRWWCPHPPWCALSPTLHPPPPPQCPHPLEAPNTHGSNGPLPQPSEIHGGGMAVLQGSGWLSPTPARCPLHPRQLSSPTPAAMVLLAPHLPPSPLSQARYWWHWCSRAAASRRLRPR
jgi:hypothetical protein